MAQNSVAPDHDRLTFADGYVLDAPCRSSFDAAMALIGEHGGVKPARRSRRTRMLWRKCCPSRKVVATDCRRRIGQRCFRSPVAELRKYEAVKGASDALVCFAQNGYFELYGKDAEKPRPWHEAP